MTSILGLATGTVYQAQEIHRLPVPELPIPEEPSSDPEQAYMESLLELDAPGWGRFFNEHEEYQAVRGRLERLIAIWLNQHDYRELRKLAEAKTQQPPAKAVDAIIEEWITDKACIRLASLIAAMRFPDPEVPTCFALCSAHRAIQHEVDHARMPKGLTEEEIEAAVEEMLESSDEDMALAFLGFEGESA